MNPEQLALNIPCPTCGSVPGDKCIATSGAFTRKPHEGRVAPMRLAFAAAGTDHAPAVLEPKGPGRVKRAASKAARILGWVRAFFAAEWRYMVAYAASSVAVFAAVVVLQRFWPNETLAVWGPTWRIALIMVGAYSLVFLGLEKLLRDPTVHDVDDIYGNCLVCGAPKDQACLSNQEIADRNRLEVVA